MQFDLSKGWRLHESYLNTGWEQWPHIHELSDGWYDCCLPADVRMPLIENGIIKDPVLADYCRETEWIERRAWWFEKTFHSSDVDMNQDIMELVLEGLDTKSDIIFNGQYIGSHCSVHYPFRYDIKPLIKEGENLIIVRITSGLEEISDQELSEISYATCLDGGDFRGDGRRAFVRRPQYTVGWDWGPKVITCGITGNVYLEGHKKIALREVYVRTEKAASDAKIKVMLNVENIDWIGSRTGSYKVKVSYQGRLVSSKEGENILFTSGYNYFTEELDISGAQLWWPNGYGEQPLYEIEVEAESEGAVEQYPVISYGIRTIELDTSFLSGDERWFRLIVNGRPIFCKGGNWIPNDFIYARVSEHKYQVLIDEAIEANFNMLRVWGGGLYERDLFYRLCTQRGILIWHDFMLACSSYPDHLKWFREEMRAEMDYQTKRLRNYSCMGLFCGTNEMHWLFNNVDNPRWDMEHTYEHQYGMRIANVIAKEVIHANCPSIPYWNSSPYGGKRPNGENVGDIHFWWNAFMSTKMEERIEAKDYDKLNAKFVSEYGFVGPCCKKSILEYLDGESTDRQGRIWQMHTNGCEKDAVNAAIEKNYVDHAEKLSLDDYILYAGMVQGTMYSYSLESMKFKPQCSGSLFWMYNDAWGEVGWTIVDYYLRRKIAYYGVKRALAHQKFTMRLVDGNVVLQGINDTQKELCVRAEWGYVSFDGKIRETEETQLQVEPGERQYFIKKKLPQYDYKKGTIMLFVNDDEISNSWLRLDDMRNLVFDKQPVYIVSDEEKDNDRIITVRCDGFAHGVYIEGDYRCSDNYFDLLPGETKKIVVKNAKGEHLKLSSVR